MTSARPVLPAKRRACQRNADSFRLDILRKLVTCGLVEVVAVFEFADHLDIEIMRPGRDVARVDPLHAAFLQCFEFLEAVDVMRRKFTVDFDLDGIEPELFVVVDLDEDGDLRIGRIQKPFFENREFGCDTQYVGFDFLDLSVQALHIVTRNFLRGA